MKAFHFFRVCILIGAFAFSLSAKAAQETTSANSFSPEQQTQIQTIVHDYLLNHPEILIQVAQKLQQNEAIKVQQQSHQIISNNLKPLFFSTKSPVAGNPKGDVTLIEFFDYQCPHCKSADPIITQLIQSHANLRVVFKEFPIFGATSEYAARAALAAVQQGKYNAFHSALMKANEPLNEKEILSIAKSVGLDIDKLKSAMNDPSITDELKGNMTLATNLSLPGTPVFIVAPTPVGTTPPEANKTFLVPGGTTLATLNNLIKEAQNK